MTKVTFKSENGVKYETHASIKRRISEKFGFQQKKIILMEGSSSSSFGGYICDSVAFQVCGLGYWTDFETLQMDPAYNDREED